jgi:hypothetical protein
MNNGTFLLGIFGLFSAVCFITWTVSRTVLRMRQLQVQPPRSDLEARLERIESAVEAIAIEVERNGELQRFNARRSMDELGSGSPAGPRPD